MNRFIHTAARPALFLCVCIGALLQLSCQSPTETPPSNERTVTIQVQNGLAAPLPLVPVAMYDGARGETPDALLEQQVTDQSGMVRFRRTIPSTGASYLFVVGDDVTGRIRLRADLLCRDTVMVVVLQTADIPCGGSQNYSMIIDDVCAMNTLGQRFTDSTEMILRSSCDLPLTFTWTTPAPADEAWLKLFDASGRGIEAQPFTLPARGMFSIRAFASPKDSTTQHYSAVFTGVGTGGVTVTLTIDIEVRARNCNKCNCDNDSVIVSYGLVQVGQKKVLTATLPLNQCLYNRLDRIVQGLEQGSAFTVLSGPASITPTGSLNELQVQFQPAELRAYQAEILIEHQIPEENKVCTTRVVLRGQGCGPICVVDSSNLGPDSDNRHNHLLALTRTRAYEQTTGLVCLKNIGLCGDLTIAGNLETPVPRGFSLGTSSVIIPAGGRRCFDVQFAATDEVVWPDGHGKPAVVNHQAVLQFTDCGGKRSVHLTVVVDTIPIEFSRCIYQWDQNQNYGYNFTPAAGKGEDRFDPQIVTAQISDIGVMAVSPGVSADVLIRSGWKFIKAGVSEAQFNWDDMAHGTNGWDYDTEYLEITRPAGFVMTPNATLVLRSVYSVRIERGGAVTYACIRVREVSMDGDGKLKICLDVLYPMIKEN